MRYRDKNQKNYIERITNTKNNNNVEGSTKKTTQRKSYVKIVLKSTKSENCCTRRKGEELESSKAKYRSLDRSISQQKGHLSREFSGEGLPRKRVVPITHSE